VAGNLAGLKLTGLPSRWRVEVVGTSSSLKEHVETGGSPTGVGLGFPGGEVLAGRSPALLERPLWWRQGAALLDSTSRSPRVFTARMLGIAATTA